MSRSKRILGGALVALIVLSPLIEGWPASLPQRVLWAGGLAVAYGLAVPAVAARVPYYWPAAKAVTAVGGLWSLVSASDSLGDAGGTLLAVGALVALLLGVRYWRTRDSTEP